MSVNQNLVEVSDTRGGSRGIVKETFRNPLALASAIILVIIVLAAIAAPLLATQGPNDASFDDVFAHISGDHWLGGDSAGRDVFSRLLYGARISIGSALLAVVVAMGLGVPSGLIAGYFGKTFDSVLSWISSLLIALPGIVVLLALRTVTGSSVWMSMLVFGVLLAPSFFVLVRATVSNVRNELYVDAARVAGLSDARIIARHILGVVKAPIVIQASMVTAIALFIQSGLEFLGFGELSRPSWGGMLNEAFANIFRGPQLLVWPGLALGVTCAALALFANGLRDALEGSAGAPTLSRKHLLAAEAAAGAASVGEPDPEALLEVSDLRVAYATGADQTTEVVHGVSLKVMPGEVIGLVGESGSGKTQTALSIMGLLPEGGRVAGGAVRFKGEEVSGRAKRQLLGRAVAYIPQEPITNLDPSFTVGSQLTEPLRVVHGMSTAEANVRALELLRSVGIADPERVYDSYPHQISGGMAQRVLIAGAISGDPELVIADEPTTALDVTVQAEILDVLRRLQRERQMAVVLVTHNFGVVADLCERVYVMKQGEVVETAGTRALYADPQHQYSQLLLSHILEGGPARAELDALHQKEVLS